MGAIPDWVPLGLAASLAVVAARWAWGHWSNWRHLRRVRRRREREFL